jgi:hypothetical protein
MDNFLIVIVILYFAINILGRTTKKKPSNQEDSIEYSENIENIDSEDEYLPNFLECSDIEPEVKNDLLEIEKEKEKEKEKPLEPQKVSATEKKTNDFIIRKKNPIKKLNLSKKALKNAIVMAEVLGKPVSMK